MKKSTIIMAHIIRIRIRCDVFHCFIEWPSNFIFSESKSTLQRLQFLLTDMFLTNLEFLVELRGLAMVIGSTRPRFGSVELLFLAGGSGDSLVVALLA